MIPEPNVFGPCSSSIAQKVDTALTAVEERKGRIVAILGGHGNLEVQAHCKSDGVVSLKGVAISGFRMVRVPRVWDNPEHREAERDRMPSLVGWRSRSRQRSMSG
jgi:hypothetical protein